MKQKPVTFFNDDLQLEGVWLAPDGEGPFPAVVVSHPFPPGGGTMDSSVVVTVWKQLAEHGIAALRYNFRGTGRSEGSFDEGNGEQLDVAAALEFVLAQDKVDPEKVGLSGYSFGAMMSAPVAFTDERVKALALIAPPLPDNHWQQLDAYENPYLVLMGDRDQMVPVEPFRQRLDDSAVSEHYRMIPRADHFFGGYEAEIGGIVADFFAGVLLS